MREVNQLMIEISKRMKEKKKEESAKQLLHSIHLADAVFHGSAPLHIKKGSSIFKRWRERTISQIKKLIGIKPKRTKSVWDKITKRSNRI